MLEEIFVVRMNVFVDEFSRQTRFLEDLIFKCDPFVGNPLLADEDGTGCMTSERFADTRTSQIVPESCTVLHCRNSQLQVKKCCVAAFFYFVELK